MLRNAYQEHLFSCEAVFSCSDKAYFEMLLLCCILKNYLTCAPLCHQTSTAFSTGEGKAGSKQRGDGHVCISPQQYGNCGFQGGRPAPAVLGWT